MKQESFSSKTLTLSVLTAVFAQCVLQGSALPAARTMILQGLPMALGLTLISALVAGAEERAETFSGQGFCAKILCGAFAVWFGRELLETLSQLQQLCWEQFSSMAAVGLLPLLLWAGWVLEPEVFPRSASVLYWAAGLAILLWLLGLQGRFHWENLMESASPQGVSMPLYAEYFALPLFCKKQELRRGSWLPVKAFCVMAGVTLVFELLLGPGSIPAEIMGQLSRFDAVVVLAGLALALFRGCVLVQTVRQLLKRIGQMPEPVEEAS